MRSRTGIHSATSATALEMVEGWLAWYAIKQNYAKVIQVLATRQYGPCLSDLGVPSSALALHILHQIVIKHDVENYPQALDIVHELYLATQDHVGMELVERITAALKCKFLFRLLERNRPDIMACLNHYFPRSSPDRFHKVQLSRSQRCHSNFRSFFLTLLANAQHRQAYLKTRYPREFGAKFEDKLQELTERFLSKIAAVLHQTPLEKILADGVDSSFMNKLCSYNLAAIEILLDAMISSNGRVLPESTCLDILQQLRPPLGTGIMHNQTSSDWFESQKPSAGSCTTTAVCISQKRQREDNDNGVESIPSKRLRHFTDILAVQDPVECEHECGTSNLMNKVDRTSNSHCKGNVQPPCEEATDENTAHNELMQDLNTQPQGKSTDLLSGSLLRGVVYRMKSRSKLKTILLQDTLPSYEASITPSSIRISSVASSVADQSLTQMKLARDVCSGYSGPPPGQRHGTRQPTSHSASRPSSASKDTTPRTSPDSGPPKTHQKAFLDFLQQNGVDLPDQQEDNVARLQFESQQLLSSPEDRISDSPAQVDLVSSSSEKQKVPDLSQSIERSFVHTDCEEQPVNSSAYTRGSCHDDGPASIPVVLHDDGLAIAPGALHYDRPSSGPGPLCYDGPAIAQDDSLFPVSCSLECDNISIVSGSVEEDPLVIPSSNSIDKFDAVCLGSQNISRATLPPIHQHLEQPHGKKCIIKLFRNQMLQIDEDPSISIFS